MQALKDICKNENIKFDKYNQHIYCITHIFNFAIQDILVTLKADKANKNELSEEQNIVGANEIIPKVS